ncbi:class I SAM-dependent methyltransferase [Microlunatus endophyticus]|uniref:class I SAM-dependent methyltransferase n=1 Tax=Microlunatus endophyticus TaxID=1716077 RepID=UPI001E4B373E|nr:class I SAM-dependent methyltransferase [Microlunatus endophyticus]
MAERLAEVRTAINHYLDMSGTGFARVISMCSGDGRDLLGALAVRDDASRVEGLLVEYDPGLAERARKAIEGSPAHLTVRCADAADSSVYAEAAPAELVLMCGVFGNISDQDVHGTIAALPQLCGAGAHVIWTRHREGPDLTPLIREWFRTTGFEEVSFVAPDNASWSVGSHRFTGTPQPLDVGAHWFNFVR